MIEPLFQITIITIPAPIKVLRGPRGPRIFLLGLKEIMILYVLVESEPESESGHWLGVGVRVGAGTDRSCPSLHGMAHLLKYNLIFAMYFLPFPSNN